MRSVGSSAPRATNVPAAQQFAGGERTRVRRWVGLLVAVCGLVEPVAACSRTVPRPSEKVAEDLPERLKELLVAEVTRESSLITLGDVSSRDVRTRRGAARALSRVGGDATKTLLEHALSDEDPEVVAWAAEGLGRLCQSANAESIVRRIKVRAATFLLRQGSGVAELTPAGLDPWYALAGALGHCQTEESERVLRSWLTVDPELGRVAASGLDVQAESTKHLDATTVVGLVDALETDRGSMVALLALSRIAQVEPLVSRRLLALAPRLLETAGIERRYLMRVLPLTGDASIPILERAAVDDSRYHALERIEALRALGKLGTTGQLALTRVLKRIANYDEAPSEAILLNPRWLVLTELFEQLKEVPQSSRAHLAKLAGLAVTDNAKPAVLRRISHLRCRSAALLTDDAFSPLFDRCDASPEQAERKLAQLLVLERVRIRGRLVSLYEQLAADRDPVVAMAALRMLPEHSEIHNAEHVLKAALGSESMGLVATAAGLVAALSTVKERSPNLELTTAMEQAMNRTWPEDAVEVRISLVDAAAQLGLLSVKPRLIAECNSPVPLVRQHAEQAIHRLGDTKQRCVPPTKRLVPKELEHLVTAPVRLRFETDVGRLELQLDPKFAPLAVTRLVDLAKSGFYDGVRVHRVVPGFVVQLGERAGDGYGGSGAQPLPCELAPQPFGPLDAGMALSGSDSGSSQFFVTLGPYPQLGRSYSRIGKGGSGWDQLVVGDRIQKVEVIR